MGLTNVDSDLLPGTLELLVLKALLHEPRHGYGIVEHLRMASGEALEIGESALALLHAHSERTQAARQRTSHLRAPDRDRPARAGSLRRED
jgi:hypothetical protein